jgi:hypothetical protein
VTAILTILKWTPGAILFRFVSPIVVSAWQAGQRGEAAILTAVAVLSYVYVARAIRRRVFGMLSALLG